MPVIDIHTHVLGHEWLELLRAHGAPRYGVTDTPGKLPSISCDGAPFLTPSPAHFDYELRIRDMDAAGVDIGILSLTCPNVYWGSAQASLRAARSTNEEMAAAQLRYPDRLRWMTSLPWMHVREALEETVEPIIYAEALDLIEAHRAAGHRVYLVSASPEEIVEPLAEHLGVDGCIATRAVVDDEGRYAGEMEFYSYGPFKADAIRELAEATGIDLAESSAYSDSYTDLPMLEVVGHPVAVNPDRVLAKVAREREWEVMQFTKPVRLRDRVGVPSLSTTATAAGVAAAAAAVGIAAWRASRRASA